MEDEARKKEDSKVEQRARQVWKMIIKAILVRKFVADKYDRGDL